MPADGSSQVRGKHDRLAAHRQLAMHRLPELLSDACDAFEVGRGRGLHAAGSAVSAIRAESVRLRHLMARSGMQIGLS